MDQEYLESTDSSSITSQLQLPPGFRFHPTDEELVVHYLKRKISSSPLPVTIIADIDLYKFDPWELPSKAVFGKQEWYFFTPRDRKYPNGARPNRAAISGYWKATGTDKPIMSSTSNGTQKVGVKKALVFYSGKPPKGVKTNWIMHEFRLIDTSIPNSKPLVFDPINRKASLRLDDWVLCRIYMKNSAQVSTTMEPGMEEYLRAAAVTSNPTELVVSAGQEDSCNFMDRVLTGEGNNIIHRNNSQLPSPSCSSKAAKRSLTCELWNGAKPRRVSYGVDNLINGYGSVASGSEDQNTSSYVSLMNQLPIQNTLFQSNGGAPIPLIGSLADSVLRHQFQLPNMNWDS